MASLQTRRKKKQEVTRETTWTASRQKPEGRFKDTGAAWRPLGSSRALEVVTCVQRIGCVESKLQEPAVTPSALRQSWAAVSHTASTPQSCQSHPLPLPPPGAVLQASPGKTSSLASAHTVLCWPRRRSQPGVFRL